jgi:hypothetical protein
MTSTKNEIVCWFFGLCTQISTRKFNSTFTLHNVDRVHSRNVNFSSSSSSSDTTTAHLVWIFCSVSFQAFLSLTNITYTKGQKKNKIILCHAMTTVDGQRCMEVSGQFHAHHGFFTPENEPRAPFSSGWLTPRDVLKDLETIRTSGYCRLQTLARPAN